MSKTDQLRKALENIGYKTRYCGCDTWNVISAHGKETDILFDNYSIWVENQKIFGKDSRKDKYLTMGVCKFNLDKCEIKTTPEHDYVSVSIDGAFIMFRNPKQNDN